MQFFQNPVQNDPWTGDYDATWERSRCLQKNDLRPLQTIQGGEDCLYLNVFRPKVSESKWSKVMPLSAPNLPFRI